jgi:mannosyltransferase
VDLSTRSPRLARVQQRERVRAGRFDPAIVAVFAAVVCAAGAARPSLWFDEAATISASTRSVPELWRLVHNIDAVHGLYYLVMHGWFTVFPATEFWSRLSSCLAVGIAAAGVVVVAKQFSTRTVAVGAGVVFAILPRVTWAGIEARSYALTAAAAVWLTVLVVAAARRNAAALWPLYGLALVVSTLLNVFVVLMVLVHAVVVPVVANRRATVVWWAATSTVAVLVVAPFLAFCRGQIAQVRWISPIDAGTVLDIAKEQYFDHSVSFPVLTVVVLAAVLVARRQWDPPNRPLTAARPAAYEKLVDPGRGLRGPQRNRLWDAHLGIWGVADRVRQCTVLWTVSERDPTVPERQSGPGLDPGARLKRAPAYQVPQNMGFHIVERWQFSFAQVVKSTR